VLRAAVVVPIVLHADPTIVFVRRAAHLRRNPGQIAFPGGAVDAQDGDDPQAAALREFEEELGVARDRIAVLGRLDDVVTLALNARVTPFVGTVAPPVAWRPDHRETESVHEVPLAALYEPGALHEGDESVVHDGRRYVVRTWQFDHGGIHVWGATGRMLRLLVERFPDPALLLPA
jgi:8-oxo-dGTP pyrophosphatase MutT (NUDIX family)